MKRKCTENIKTETFNVQGGHKIMWAVPSPLVGNLLDDI